jgi:hypothetical protein
MGNLTRFSGKGDGVLGGAHSSKPDRSLHDVLLVHRPRLQTNTALSVCVADHSPSGDLGFHDVIKNQVASEDSPFSCGRTSDERGCLVEIYK